MSSTVGRIEEGPLRLTVAEIGATRTVAVAGELDLANAPVLQGLIETLERDGAAAIVVDLEALEFIDSTGLALLVGANRRLEQSGVCLRFVPATAPAVRRVLSLTGLDKGLPFLADGNAAGNRTSSS